MNVFSAAKWIAPPNKPADVNLYMIFRTTFQRGGDAPVFLRVAVAGNYAAYCNGKLAAFGQYTDYPARKTYSETDVSIFCQSGKNELEFSVWYSGQCFTSHTDGAVPGLIAEVVSGDSVLASSSCAWSCAWDTRYAMGPREKCSGSLNWTFDFSPGKIPETFVHAVELPEKYQLSVTKRPVGPPIILDSFSGKLIRSGNLFRRHETDMETGAQFCADELDCTEEKANGSFFIFDLGREVAGLLRFEADCAPGTVIDAGHAEYLNEQNRLNVHFPGNRNFVDQIHPEPGKTSFFHTLRRFGARYLEFHVIGQGHILSAGVDPVGFESMRTIPEIRGLSDFWQKARFVSAETLRLCLHEKYENCPWREQSICMYDARDQMLFGYSLWGNYAHARAMLDLFGQSIRPDGHLAVAVPSEVTFNIPSFTFLWFRAMQEYALYSGDLSLAREYAGQMKRMCDEFLSRRKGILCIPPEEGLWNYCEPPEMEYCSDPPNAFYNLYLIFALRSAAELFRLLQEPDYADELRQKSDELGAAAESYFFDPESGFYADHLNSEGKRELFHGHTQMLFLAAGLIPEERRRTVMEGLRSEAVPFPAVNALSWLIDGIFEFGTDDDHMWLHDRIKTICGAMLDADAQTWWEVPLGKEYGNGAGSLCHGWSAVPAHYIASRMLGIRPLEPGFRTFTVEPFLPDVNSLSGSVCTPFGPITVELTRRTDGSVARIVSCPPECRICEERS